MWSSIAAALVGIWLMAAPAVLSYGDPAANSDRIAGPLAATFAIIAIWEATRGVRRLNLPVAAWLLAAPWLLGYGEEAATWSSSLSGALLAVLSLLPAPPRGRLGGGWAAIWRNGGSA